MSVLKLKPACKEYLWGGDRLIKEFHKEYDGEKLAETWELSCHPDGASTIVNGPWAGKSLAEYIDASGKEVLGKNCRRFQEFPILIKFIDAKDNLSIQVHPDNSYALKNENQYGKTEMWYVVDCKEGAFLYYGFAKEIDKDEFRERIENNTLLEVLNKVPVQKGDVFFIEAGTIHAIGKDIVIAEIQQNSNVTYRVYDYGRVDKEGKKRDLHIEKALEVTNRKPMLRSRSSSPHLAKCDYFTVDKLNLDGRMMKKMIGMVTEDSFANLLIVEGKGVITCNGEQIDFAKGDSLFFPAGCGEFQLEGECEALITTIGEKVISDCRSMPDLMKSVNKILLSDEDSLLWELCGGDLDKITEDMIIQAAKEKDETAEKILFASDSF
jgi:mannose-6-phosphate isomerase